MIISQVIYVDARARGKQFLRGSEHAAGYDVCVFPRDADDNPLDEVVIRRGGKPTLVHSGAKLWIKEEGFYGHVVPRSSTGHKLNIMLGNTAGVIDSDYQGELFMSLYNRGPDDVVLRAGDRVCQIIFLPFEKAAILETDSFEATARGEGGYGSSGR
jgi:dUTP pyrophosphatase